MPPYGLDLAFIHDAGFGDYARRSAPALLDILRRCGIGGGLVVDLGCGSGIWAEALVGAGYDVLAIDMSPDMINLARQRAPQAEFAVGSMLSAKLPECSAVTSIGECINYAFDPSSGPGALQNLFAKVHEALRPGGVFIFDFAEPGQALAEGALRFVQTDDWAVLVEATEREGELKRAITTYRRSGEHFRRSNEIHRLNLYASGDVSALLKISGFTIRLMRRYGEFALPKRHAAFVARKL